MGRPVDESPCPSPLSVMRKPADLSPMSDVAYSPRAISILEDRDIAYSSGEASCGSLSSSDDSILSSCSDSLEEANMADARAPVVACPSPRGILKRRSGGSKKRVGLTFHPSVLLWTAVQQGSFGELERLLQSAGDNDELHEDLMIDRTNHQGISALHLCCFAGATESVRLLLECGASPNVVDKDGWAPAHAASIGAHFAILRLLKEAGADLLQRDVYGRTPAEVTGNEVTRAVLRKLAQKQKRKTKCTSL